MLTTLLIFATGISIGVALMALQQGERKVAATPSVAAPSSPRRSASAAPIIEGEVLNASTHYDRGMQQVQTLPPPRPRLAIRA